MASKDESLAAAYGTFPLASSRLGFKMIMQIRNVTTLTYTFSMNFSHSFSSHNSLFASGSIPMATYQYIALQAGIPLNDNESFSIKHIASSKSKRIEITRIKVEDADDFQILAPIEDYTVSI